ncbi:MAG: aldo/keto reductase [Actinobacteria bacterium]|nr:aldo/keto reductase [Actinomycetota bacterium]
MRYRTFGKTGWQVSAIGMGCWALSGQWGPVEEPQAIATVHAALDAGVNLFDTADAYGPRRSEEFLGKALLGVRHRAFVATKVGNLARGAGHPLAYTHPEHIYVCCDASLHRLRTDYIDFYQCHIRHHEYRGIFVEAFERLREEGKIRAYGVSSFFPDDIVAFDVHGRCAGVQLPYSVLERAVEQDALPLCAERRIGTLVRGPLAQGVLSGKFTATTVFEDSVRKGWNAGDARARFEQRLQIVERLRPLTGPQRSLVDVALGFVLAHPAVTCAIPGMKTPEQARANAAAGDVALPPAEVDAIRALA